MALRKDKGLWEHQLGSQAVRNECFGNNQDTSRDNWPSSSQEGLGYPRHQNKPAFSGGGAKHGFPSRASLLAATGLLSGHLCEQGHQGYQRSPEQPGRGPRQMGWAQAAQGEDYHTCAGRRGSVCLRSVPPFTESQSLHPLPIALLCLILLLTHPCVSPSAI